MHRACDLPLDVASAACDGIAGFGLSPLTGCSRNKSPTTKKADLRCGALRVMLFEFL